MYILKQRTSWNELELPGKRWNYLESPVTRWTQQRIDTEKQEIHRKRSYVQYHCPIENHISNSLSSQRAPSEMFAGRTAWNRMKPVMS